MLSCMGPVLYVQYVWYVLDPVPGVDGECNSYSVLGVFLALCSEILPGGFRIEMAQPGSSCIEMEFAWG